jgi:dCMP deaminase
MNAISSKTVMSLENCTMYVTCFPCIECAKLIAPSGIRHIIYIEDHCCQKLNDEQIVAAQLLLNLSGVSYYKLH